jgi:putative spermidine/putrescine transport system permease protein
VKLDRAVFLLIVGGIYAFLIAPIVIVVLLSINSAEYLSFPPKGFSLRWYAAFFRSAPFIEAFKVSFIVAALAAMAAGVIGTCAALYFVRYARRTREAFRTLVVAPLLLPEVLTAMALLFFFYQISLGTRTILPLWIGHVTITLPFVFLTVSAALHNMPQGVEESARTLGATRWTVFRRITLPLIKQGIVAGMLLAFIQSFDNVSVSLLLKGVGTTTLPIQLFDYLQLDFDPTAAAASTISIVLILITIALIDRIFGLRAVRF